MPFHLILWAMQISSVTFTATPREIFPGEAATLCYSGGHIRRASISPNQDMHPATRTNCVELHPIETTTYTLAGEDNQGREIRQFVTVHVKPSVRITQFYAYPGYLTRGERASVCYGVERAKEVWLIHPQRRKLDVSTNQCFPAAPRYTSRYTLSATGVDGRKVSISFTLRVGAK